VNMTTPPDVMVVIDSHTEMIAVREARRMGVPVVAVVDTNSDPDQVDWIVPGNDDALRAIRLFVTKLADAVAEGRSAYEQTQLAGQKAEGVSADGGDNVEYVDTSAYESYEKQEGDFVDAVEGAPEPVADAAPVAPGESESPTS
jgi:small subunit ribosomal protein S2